MPSQIMIWKKRILFPFTILFSILLLAACEKQDSPPIYSVTQNYFPTDPNALSQYGHRVHLTEDFLFVAAPSATNSSALVKGLVYVYRNMDGAWKPTQILEDPSVYSTAAGVISFGASMDWENGLLAIGNASQSQVQLYQLDSRKLWQHKQTITEPSGTAFFGTSLSFDHGDLAVGAPSLGISGTVELYSTDSSGDYQYKASLTCTVAPCNVGGSKVGDSVKMVNGRVVVGSPGSNTALVFYLSGGTWQSQILTGSNLVAAGPDFFGTLVHFDGSRIVISAPAAPVNASPSGAIYIFDEVSPNTWEEKLIIGPKNPAAILQFGQSFIYNNNTLLVGSPSVNGAGGAIHIFHTLGRDNWTETQYIQHTTASAYLGISLAFDGSRIFAGGSIDQVDATGAEGGLYLLQTPTTQDVILEGRAGPIP